MYTVEQIKKAYWEMFHQSGEWWFRERDTNEQMEKTWGSFLEVLKQASDDNWVDLNLPYYSPGEDSLIARGLNRPGVLIDTEDGVYLIGHINDQRGVCDDCTAFERGIIVKRYKIVWSEGNQ